MTVFQYIKTILDEEYLELQRRQQDPDARIREALEGLSKNYMTLSKTASALDYSDPATRFAYVFRYVTCHSHLVRCALGRCSAFMNSLAADSIVVSCIGGGPGSDFLGLTNLLIDNGFAGNILCYLLDREAAWGDNWSDLGTRWPDLCFHPSTYFQSFDVTDQKSWERQRKYLRADLFTFVYFASEVQNLQPGPEPFFRHLFQEAKPGAMFLNVDNSSSVFVNWFEKLARSACLDLLSDHSCDMRLPSVEEKTDLGPYATKFGSPKLTADVKCRIFRKPD